MSKTPIGFFKEPLSQEEVSYIYDQLHQGWVDQYWNKVYQELKNMVVDVAERFRGSHVSEEFFQERISAVVSIWVERRKKLREHRDDVIYSASVVWSDTHPGYYDIEYSPSIIQMRDGGYKCPTTRANGGHTQASLVDQINRHLIQNPELRIVPPHREPLNSANDELVNLLRSRGYHSETSNNLPDFSEFLVKLIK